MNSKKTTIKPTKSTKIIAQCAQMMSESDPWIKLGIGYEHCLKAFEGAWREVYVLKYGDEVAGFVIIQPLGTFKGYIQTLFVAEAFRGKGFAKVLLDFCQERILKISPNIFICVSSFNDKAKKIYLDYGFQEVGILNNFIKQGFDEILLRKTSSPLLKS